MIGFFWRKPGRLVLLILALFFTGFWAHNGRKLPKSDISLSLNKAKPKPALVDWRNALDLDHLEVKGNQMFQTLTDGTQVQLTLDPHLQSWANKFLRTYDLPYSAIVTIDLETNKVLVMAGHSSSEPKMKTRELCLNPWAPTASVFKLVTASALLNRGVKPNTTLCYHGGLHGITMQHIQDNTRQDRSCDTFANGVAKSINPIIAKLALRYLSRETLNTWSYRYGFNRTLPFDLAVPPSPAVIPTGQLELARVAAGFWKTESSALHGALIASVAATRGLMVYPRLIDTVTRKNGKVVTPSPKVAPERVLSRSEAEQLVQMMVNTTTVGTARLSFSQNRRLPSLPPMKVAGKTGSLTRNKPFTYYSWFVGFAPAEKPKVAFSIILGNPMRWKLKAHTAARYMLSQVFKVRSTPSSLIKKDPPSSSPMPAAAIRGKKTATSG